MKRNLFLCLLLLSVIALSASRTLRAVAGQTRTNTQPSIVPLPGDAGRLNLINQAENRLVNAGKIKVSSLGAGRVPSGPSRSATPLPAYPPFVQGKVLVLYDAVAGHPFEKFGYIYAIMLSNLLGHFEANVTLMPINRYTAGSLEMYQTIFYLGSHYDNAVPATFMQDVRRTNRTVVWFKNNIWQYAWNSAYDFANYYGFSFAFMKGFDSQPGPQNQQPGFFDTITYKSLPFVKYYHYDTNSNLVYADPDLGITQINNPSKATAWLNATNSRTGQSVPYVVRSGQFWYFADIPFSFIGPRDRYLVFCDLLHDILGQPHAENHRAMLRLEDVGAKVEAKSFRALSDYLYNKRIPFSVAMIPTYRDAHGVANGGRPEAVELSNATDLLNVARYARTRGGSVLMHGQTHQYETLRNPSGMSGTDWEFWDAFNNLPLNDDSQNNFASRVQTGLTAMLAEKLQPFAWETPHYQGSPNAYRAAARFFPVKYERVMYYTAENPNLRNGDFAAPQFFPYLIKADYFGQRVLPENLGNVIYCDVHGVRSMRGPLAGIACGHNVSLSQAESLRSASTNRLVLMGNHRELYENARYAWVVRDGFASMFFHPYLLQSQAGVPGMTDLQMLLNGISQLGYQWKAASSLVTGN